MKKEDIKKAVRNRYGEMAAQSSSCCGSACRDVAGIDPACEVSRRVGYTDEDLKSVPDEANLGLGCGNPVALASLKKGEVVLDLGSGAGFDCFLAAHKVGETGRVIGVDMTPEMVDKARENGAKAGWKNVEFRLGEIENLPAADRSVDVVISNCVINLSPEKEQVFAEAFRVLKQGGRLMISDLVLLKDLPDFLKDNAEAYVACVASAVRREDYLRLIENAGFRDVTVVEEATYPVEFILNDPTVEAAIERLNLPQEEVGKISGSLASIKVSAVKK